MRMLWTLVKVAVGLAIAIPFGLLLMGLTLGLVGTVLGLVFMAVRLAVVALAAYGVFRVAKFFFGFGSPSPAPQPMHPIRELTARDPYYEAAMRELDAEMGPSR